MLEAQWLWQVLLPFGFGGLISGGIVFLLCTRWLTGYLNKKGENLATKEDIAQITDLVRGVEHQYNVLIEEMKAKQQLRMAALDKRLQAHQEAFSWWSKLAVPHPEETPSIVEESRDWWRMNCLYLEPSVREALLRVIVFTSARAQTSEAVSLGLTDQIRDVWKELMEFPDILFKAVQLPAFSQEEIEAVRQQQTQAKS